MSENHRLHDKEKGKLTALQIEAIKIQIPPVGRPISFWVVGYRLNTFLEAKAILIKVIMGIMLNCGAV